MNRLVALALIIISSMPGFSQDSDRPTQPDLPGDLMIDFGQNLWTDQPDILPTKVLGSNSFGLYYNRRNRITDNISFYTAVGFSFESIAIEKRVSWFRSDAGAIVIDSLPNNVGLRKNKLMSTYFEVPIEFRIHPFGTVNGEGFFVGVGAIGGVRIAAKTKIKYDLDGETYKERLNGDFNLNRWEYGVQARLGFKTFHLFYKMYFNNQFENLPAEFNSNPRVMTFGINFSGF